MTTLSVERDNIEGEKLITNEHVKSNTNVRKALTDTGIYPEKLPLEKDIKKVKRGVKKEEKLITKNKKVK